MPMKVRYTSVNGEVIAENRAGVRKLYLSDPLGSTLALADNTQTITDRFTYWPYGEETSRTGSTPTPFRYVGTQGGYRDGANTVYLPLGIYRPELVSWASGTWRSGPAGEQQGPRGAPPGMPGLRKPPRYAPGFGDADCPGYYVLKAMVGWLAAPKCRAACKTLCSGKEWDDVIGMFARQKKFKVLPDCNPKTSDEVACTSKVYPPHPKGRPDTCKVESICFNQSYCDFPNKGRGALMKACVLLLELGNACNCTYFKGDRSEKPAEDVLKACGVWGVYCKGGGTHRG